MARFLRRGFGVLFGLLLISAPTYAWNGFGHKTVAMIACLELSDGQQAAIFELLKSHPHFHLKNNPLTNKELDFFSMGRPTGVNEAEWAILQAATWPDFVRIPRKFQHMPPDEVKVHPIFMYHKAPDHYSDTPLIAPGFVVKKLPTDLGNLMKAIAEAEATLKNASATKEERAIAFCWLAHLVGDIHQPLHCTSLFSKDFPKGDRGGNSFHIGSGNLHSFWDDILGSEPTTYHHLSGVANDLHRAANLQRGKLFELKKNHTYDTWAKESHEAAVTFAYKDGKKMLPGSPTDHERDQGVIIPPFPPQYHDGAKSIAQRRVTLAGYRLADKLGEVFPAKK